MLEGGSAVDVDVTNEHAVVAKRAQNADGVGAVGAEAAGSNDEDDMTSMATLPSECEMEEAGADLAEVPDNDPDEADAEEGFCELDDEAVGVTMATTMLKTDPPPSSLFPFDPGDVAIVEVSVIVFCAVAVTSLVTGTPAAVVVEGSDVRVTVTRAFVRAEDAALSVEEAGVVLEAFVFVVSVDDARRRLRRL